MYANKNDIKNWATIGFCGIDCYQAHVEVKAIAEDLFGDTYIFAVSRPDDKPHKVKIVMGDRPYFRINGSRFFVDEIIRL